MCHEHVRQEAFIEHLLCTQSSLHQPWPGYRGGEEAAGGTAEPQAWVLGSQPSLDSAPRTASSSWKCP